MASGLKGIVDFVGYSSGQPGAAPATAGFKGLLDFSGFSVGQTEAVPPSDMTYLRLLRGLGVILLALLFI